MVTVLKKIKGFGLKTLVALFFIFLFVVYRADFSGPDEPIYYAYTASIIDDGDLNAVNHLNPQSVYYLPSGKIGISPTYNLPDFHNHGGIVLWAPFYAYAKFVYYIGDKLGLSGLAGYGRERFTECVMAFSTVIFGIFILLFSYKLCRIFFPRNISILSTLFMFMGTPFFYFVIGETGNANILACLFSVISIWGCMNAVNMKKGDWFLYGLFFSVALAVKIDLWFQLFSVFILFLILLRWKRIEWQNGFYFLFGLVPVTIFKIINDYIKYGFFHFGEGGLFNIRGDYWFEQLFSSYRGFFYTSPIIYFCLLGFIFASVNLLRNAGNRGLKEGRNELKVNDLFLVIIFAYIFIKIFFLGFRYAWGGGTCGARPLLTEFPLFILLYARFFQSLKKPVSYIGGAVSILFVFWNLLVVSEYVAKVDLGYVVNNPGLAARISGMRDVATFLFQPKDLDLKTKPAMLLLIIFFAAFFLAVNKWRMFTGIPSWYSKNNKASGFYKIFGIFTVSLCAIYAVFTMLNVFNNRKKVERLKSEGFFENTEILPHNGFERQENFGSMAEMAEYYRLKGDVKKAERINKQKKELYGEYK